MTDRIQIPADRIFHVIGADICPEGHRPDSFYAELYWLPTIGPTALVLARRLFQLIEHGVDTVTADDLAAQLGVPANNGGDGRLPHAMHRLVMYRHAWWTEASATFILSLRWRRITDRQLKRLPIALQRAHPPVKVPA